MMAGERLPVQVGARVLRVSESGYYAWEDPRSLGARGLDPPAASPRRAGSAHRRRAANTSRFATPTRCPRRARAHRAPKRGKEEAPQG